MARLRAANNARTTLAQSISETANAFAVTNAAPFPDPPFRITVEREIMEVGLNDRNSNTFGSVQRGLEGTAAASHPAGAVVENRFTAGSYNELATQAALDAHTADNTNPHQVTAEQAFAIGGIPSGTNFPSNPANYTLFYRTDLGKLFIYLP
ncbi:MAG: hypothetical protein ACUVRO_13415 [Armatimonadota bacterium]